MKFHTARKRVTVLFWWIVVISLLVSLTGGDCLSASNPATIRIGGTGGAFGAMKELVAVFQKKRPNVTVTIIPHLGTRGGLNGVLKGAIDIGIAGRRLTPQELAQGLKEIEYARSPFVFVTRSKGARMDLTLDMIAGIYRGDIRKWPDGTPVRPILRPTGDVDILMLKAISPAMRDALSRAEAREGMTIALDDQENCDLLEKVKGSFGTSTLTQIISEKRSLTLLPLNGVTPGIKAMVDGRYPYYKPFLIVTGPKSSPLSKEFLTFVKSAEGRKILMRTGNHLPEVR